MRMASFILLAIQVHPCPFCILSLINAFGVEVLGYSKVSTGIPNSLFV